MGSLIWAAGLLGIRLQPAICFTEGTTGFLRNSSELTAINPRALLAQHSHRMTSAAKKIPNDLHRFTSSLLFCFPPKKIKQTKKQQPKNKQKNPENNPCVPLHIVKYVLILRLQDQEALPISALLGNQFVITIRKPSKAIKQNELQL